MLPLHWYLQRIQWGEPYQNVLNGLIFMVHGDTIHLQLLPSPCHVIFEINWLLVNSRDSQPRGCHTWISTGNCGIRHLPSPVDLSAKTEVPWYFQPWYTDDGAAMAWTPIFLEFFDRLCVLGHPFGYFPEQQKSILIISLDVNQRATIIEASHELKITNRSCYLGGFIGENLQKPHGLEKKWPNGQRELPSWKI